MKALLGTFASQSLVRASLAIMIVASLFAITSVAPKAVMAASMTSKATKGADAKAPDSHIKSAKGANSAAKNKGGSVSIFAAPKEKGGKATKGGTARVTFHNCGYAVVDFYVDGTYVGTAGPQGDLTIYVEVGYHNLYARAEFDDGTYYYWSKANVYCGSIDWSLTL